MAIFVAENYNSRKALNFLKTEKLLVKFGFKNRTTNRCHRRIVTNNEKWVYYWNPQRKKLDVQNQIYSAGTQCCGFRKFVVYHELLQPD